MAQDFTGSNNINLLLPNGQFGTRMAGGKDSASERYIFTQQNPLTKYIYPDDDLPVLNYLQDDGTPVEPGLLCTHYPNDPCQWSKGDWHRI